MAASERFEPASWDPGTASAVEECRAIRLGALRGDVSDEAEEEELSESRLIGAARSGTVEPTAKVVGGGVDMHSGLRSGV